MRTSATGKAAPPGGARAGSPTPAVSSGFTLVEIVIVLTVIGLLAGIAVPSIDGIVRERQARAPISELVRMARSIRQRAIEEQVPYQIAFDANGFHAARYFNPYGGAEEFTQVLQDMEEMQRRRELVAASQERIGALAEIGFGEDEVSGSLLTGSNRSSENDEIFYETYELPEGISYELLFWGQSEWTPIQSGRFERWVFQPSGMCLPLKIRLQSDGAFFEVEFHPLTADVKDERGWVE